MSTYTPIVYTTLASNNTSIMLSNLPQDYTDLVIVLTGTTNDTGTNNLRLQFNSDGGSNYSATRLLGSGSAISSARNTSNTYAMVGDIASSIFTTVIQISNYSSSQMYKTVISRTGNDNAYLGAYVATWRNTNAINTINLATNPALVFNTGTTVSIYGIQAGTPKAQGGQIVTTDGTYWYHVFLNSGKFTPSTTLTCDYLVIGGGGGGMGYAYGGGGGAGGLRSTVGSTGGGGSLESSLSLSATDYTVIVGAGGFGGTGEITGNYYSTATNGNDTIFSSITSTGGGRGGGGRGGYSTGTQGNGGNGGSGGGASGNAGATAGTRVTGQGYAGGTGSTDSASYANGGGGGGAGAVGTNANSGSGGNGGIGVQISALATPTNTGVSGYFAGGGGGGGTGSEGSGGTGGGGGANEGGGTSGTANTGSGGGSAGGSSAGSNGGNGGSGLVIVRYAV